jgi:hypothetical protein
VLPTTSRRAAAAAVLEYNALRPLRTRMLRRVVGGAVKAGADRLISRGFAVAVRTDISNADLGEHLLTAHVARLVGDPAVGFGLGIREPGPNSKPTLQGFAMDGGAAAYAKVGWNATTRQLVQQEARALEHVNGRLPSLVVPKLRHSGTWRDRDLVVTDPLPRTVRAWPRDDEPPDPDVTTGISATSARYAAALAGSPYVRRLRDRATAPGWDEGVRRTVLDTVAVLESYAGEAQVEFGAWHGDWVPWNVGTADGLLVVWDWEHYATDVPVGFDIVHWHVQVAQVRRGAEPLPALRGARAAITQTVGAVQPHSAAGLLLTAAYAVELTARTEEMRIAGAGESRRWLPHSVATLAGLREELLAGIKASP